ncbi:MAG: hypothetical protein JJU01_09955 [Alkalibacterium sp.]|nr:hypothetical protein [Alkalibacterium sp.]TVP92681.1 MAG: hypothetical protein EA249_01855 [Alkalibacterium sp.]
MNKFDEYQRLQRYKFGYYAMLLTVILNIINFFVVELYGFQWAETPRIEPLIIILIVTVFFTISLVYSGAYFAKRESVLVLGIVFLLTGGVSIRTALLFPLFENGQVTMWMTNFIVGINFLAIPATYLVRISVDKLRDVKEKKEA